MRSEIEQAAERARRVKDGEPVERVYRDDFEGAEWKFANDIDALAHAYIAQSPTYADLTAKLAEAERRLAALDDPTPLTPEAVMRMLPANRDSAIGNLNAWGCYESTTGCIYWYGSGLGFQVYINSRRVALSHIGTLGAFRHIATGLGIQLKEDA